MVCGVAGCDTGEKCFAPTLVVGVGADWPGCEQVCGVAGCDPGEIFFACTLADDVGADGSGCEQGMRCCWLRFGLKIFRSYIGCLWG